MDPPGRCSYLNSSGSQHVDESSLLFSTTNTVRRRALGQGVDPMGMPLFVCAGCSMRIERSLAPYLRLKGRGLCSTCLDRMESELTTGSDRNEAAPSVPTQESPMS